jgi:hypothetical protein
MNKTGMVNMDRLLSSTEAVIATGNDELYDYWDSVEPVAKAQLAKTDKEWVEWLETNLFKETDSGLDFRELPKFALKDWQERKKEIGL